MDSLSLLGYCRYAGQYTRQKLLCMKEFLCEVSHPRSECLGSVSFAICQCFKCTDPLKDETILGGCSVAIISILTIVRKIIINRKTERRYFFSTVLYLVVAEKVF